MNGIRHYTPPGSRTAAGMESTRARVDWDAIAAWRVALREKYAEPLPSRTGRMVVAPVPLAQVGR